MKKILLIGKNGQLGWELNRSLLTLGQLFAVDYPEIDLQNPGSYVEVIKEIHPNIIVNAAAYTAVDQAESEKEKNWNINATAPAILAEEARRLKSQFVHYSTDYVFDGTKGNAYLEEDIPNPLNQYGKSKLEGERLIQSAGEAYLIFRTSWVYSVRQAGGFVNKVLQWAREREKICVVNDQVSNPTWARVLAEVTSQVLSLDPGWLQEHRGLFHVACGGFTSRFEWTKMILALDPNKEEQLVKEVIPAQTDDFPTPAQRPLFSALNCGRFQKEFGVFLPDWQASLRLAMSNS